jgi:hypothetical protein
MVQVSWLLLVIAWFNIYAVGQQCDVSDVKIADYPTQSHPNHLRRVHYTFLCQPPSLSVYISGVGQTSSSGTLTYLTEDDLITIRGVDTQQRPPCLAEIKVIPNIALAGAISDVPTLTQFPVLAKPGKWEGGDFSARIFSILNNRFGSLWTMESTGVNKYVSAYHRLTDLPQNILAEVAVQVAYSNSSRQFDVSFVCRESRAKSDEWRPAQTDVVKRAAQAYVDTVFNEIGAPGK